jgi:hypothetical protein
VYQVYGAWPPDTVTVEPGYCWSIGQGPVTPVVLRLSVRPPELPGVDGGKVVGGAVGLNAGPVGEFVGFDAGLVGPVVGLAAGALQVSVYVAGAEAAVTGLVTTRMASPVPEAAGGLTVSGAADLVPGPVKVRVAGAESLPLDCAQ